MMYPFALHSKALKIVDVMKNSTNEVVKLPKNTKQND